MRESFLKVQATEHDHTIALSPAKRMSSGLLEFDEHISPNWSGPL